MSAVTKAGEVGGELLVLLEHEVAQHAVEAQRRPDRLDRASHTCQHALYLHAFAAHVRAAIWYSYITLHERLQQCWVHSTMSSRQLKWNSRRHGETRHKTRIMLSVTVYEYTPLIGSLGESSVHHIWNWNYGNAANLWSQARGSRKTRRVELCDCFVEA